jgi:hypothetical protein
MDHNSHLGHQPNLCDHLDTYNRSLARVDLQLFLQEREGHDRNSHPKNRLGKVGGGKASEVEPCVFVGARYRWHPAMTAVGPHLLDACHEYRVVEVLYRLGTGKHFGYVPFDRQGHQLSVQWLVDDYAWSGQAGGGAEYCLVVYERFDANVFEVAHSELSSLRLEIRRVRL